MEIILIASQILVLCLQSFILGVLREESYISTTVMILGISVFLINFYLTIDNIIRIGG